MTKESNDVTPTYITLPWSAFFDQELWQVVFEKLMKAPVKDYQVLLWLSKLGKTINDIAHDLATKRDEIAKEVDLDPTAPMTPELIQSAEYQEKTKKFGELLQERVFNEEYSLEPLWALILDLTNPDGHAKSFLEGAWLSAEDVMKLEESGIIKIIYPEAPVTDAGNDTQAEPEQPAQPAEDLPANEEKKDDTK